MFLEALLAFVPAFGLKKEEPKTDIWSLDSFIQWMETKNPEQKYTYADPEECLIAQYLSAKGYHRVRVTGHSAHWAKCAGILNGKHSLPPNWNHIAASNRTFGDAAKCARHWLGA